MSRCVVGAVARTDPARPRAPSSHAAPPPGSAGHAKDTACRDGATDDAPVSQALCDVFKIIERDTASKRSASNPQAQSTRPTTTRVHTLDSSVPNLEGRLERNRAACGHESNALGVALVAAEHCAAFADHRRFDACARPHIDRRTQGF